MFCEPREERPREPEGGGLGGDYGGRELMMVASEDQAVGVLHRDPAGRLERLRGLVNHHPVERALADAGLRRARRGREHDVGAIDDPAGDRAFEVSAFVTEAPQLASGRRALAPPVSFLHEPQRAIEVAAVVAQDALVRGVRDLLRQ